jgi:outer membrane protein assembly factor BamB
LKHSFPTRRSSDLIFATRPGRVIALDRQAGTRRWETDLKHPILASPIVVHGTVYVGAADKQLYALDAATGQRRWAFAAQDWIVSAVAYTDARVIVPSRHSRLHVVSADTGRQRLVYDTGQGRHIGGGAAVQGDRAYFGSSGGRVWAIDWRATTYPLDRMLLFWRSNLYLWGVLSTLPVQKGSVWSQHVSGDVIHTPAIAHQLVYVTTSRGKVVALDTATGAARWNHRCPHRCGGNSADRHQRRGRLRPGGPFGRGTVGVQDGWQGGREPRCGRRHDVCGLR